MFFTAFVGSCYVGYFNHPAVHGDYSHRYDAKRIYLIKKETNKKQLIIKVNFKNQII
jgi:hypothetical protein